MGGGGYACGAGPTGMPWSGTLSRSVLHGNNCRYCSEQHASLFLRPSPAERIKDGCAAWNAMRLRLSAGLDLCLDCHLANADR